MNAQKKKTKKKQLKIEESGVYQGTLCFSILAENRDFRYSLELLHQESSDKHPQSILGTKGKYPKLFTKKQHS